MEDKGHIAFYFIFVKGFPGFDSFPSGGDFDEDSISAHACLLVESDDSFGALDSLDLVEG
jgi:hypothetical protein